MHSIWRKWKYRKNSYDNLIQCNDYKEIVIFYRKKLDRWNKKDKLKLINIESNTFLNNNYIEELNNKLGNVKDYNTVFCCLGGRNDTEYEKVDYELSIKISNMCEALTVPHLSIISTENSDSKSKDKFLKFRGKMEEEIHNKNIKSISVFKINYVTHKEDTSFCQCIISFFCRCNSNSIECEKIGRAMVVDDLKILKILRDKGDEKIEGKIRESYTNNDIKKLALEKI